MARRHVGTTFFTIIVMVGPIPNTTDLQGFKCVFITVFFYAFLFALNNGILTVNNHLLLQLQITTLPEGFTFWRINLRRIEH